MLASSAGGWRVQRLEAEMTLHDAAMTRFGQWWTRCKRGGHAWAEGMAMHGAGPERHGVAGTLRALGWGAGLPAAALGLTATLGAWGLAILLAYPAQVLRLALGFGLGTKAGWERAIFLVLAKFPEAQGVAGYWVGRLSNRQSRLIEYK